MVRGSRSPKRLRRPQGRRLRTGGARSARPRLDGRRRLAALVWWGRDGCGFADLRVWIAGRVVGSESGMEMDMHAHIESGVGRAGAAGGVCGSGGRGAGGVPGGAGGAGASGRVLEIEADCGVPAGMSPAMVALLLTLVDVDTPLWLPAGVDDEVRAFLRFHCGCSMVDQPGEARFAACRAGIGACPVLVQSGDPAYPDQSATLLIEATDLERGRALTLSVPASRTAPPCMSTDWRKDFGVNGA